MKIQPYSDLKKFPELRSFVKYLLQERLEALTIYQVQLMQQHNVSILDYFKDMTYEEILHANSQTIREVFTKLVEEEHVERLDTLILTSYANHSVQVEERALVETITTVNHIRKRVLCRFLPDYCNGDAYQMHTILEELDAYLLESQLTSSDTYISVLKKQIRKREHFIKKINNTTPAIIYLYDLQQEKITYINNNASTILGISPEQILAMTSEELMQFTHSEDPESIFKKREINKLFEITGVSQYQCRFLNKSNTWSWLTTKEVVFKKDPDGNILQLLGTALDITLQKEIESKLLHKATLLENANASLEQFAHIASHDLKEPLRKILLSADYLLTTERTLSETSKTYMTKIVTCSQQMFTMLNDLLTLSLITNVTTFERYDLSKIWDDVVLKLKSVITETNAVLTTTKLPEALVIPNQIHLLFECLLNNALKFRNENIRPTIRLTAEYVSAGEVSYYGITEAEKYVKLTFSDNGIGFDDKFASKIFAVFQRLNLYNAYPGSGMGLTLCKKIVEHHGGYIYATGVPDQGAIFTIFLPA